MFVGIPSLMVSQGQGPSVSSTFSPNQIAGLRLWLKADTLTLNDGDLVVAWMDSSGNGFNATQGTAGQRPTYKTNIQNGLPVVRFGTALDLRFFSVPVIGATLPNTIFAVAQDSNPSSRQGILTGGGTPEQIFGFQLAATRRLQIIGSATLNSPDLSTGFHVTAAVVNGASSFIYADGTQVATGDTGTAWDGLDSILIGTKNGGTDSLSGDIGELLIYNSALSTTNRNKVEAYLKSRWATP